MILLLHCERPEYEHRAATCTSGRNRGKAFVDAENRARSCDDDVRRADAATACARRPLAARGAREATTESAAAPSISRMQSDRNDPASAS